METLKERLKLIEYRLLLHGMVVGDAPDGFMKLRAFDFFAIVHSICAHITLYHQFSQEI